MNDKNEIFGCGENDNGELGLGDGKSNKINTTYTKMMNPFGEKNQKKENLFILPINDATFLYDKEEKTLFSSGKNLYGTLGLGHKNEYVKTF